MNGEPPGSAPFPSTTHFRFHRLERRDHVDDHGDRAGRLGEPDRGRERRAGGDGNGEHPHTAHYHHERERGGNGHVERDGGGVQDRDGDGGRGGGHAERHGRDRKSVA